MERTTPHHPIQQHLGLTPSNTICPITLSLPWKAADPREAGIAQVVFLSQTQRQLGVGKAAFFDGINRR